MLCCCCCCYWHVIEIRANLAFIKLSELCVRLSSNGDVKVGIVYSLNVKLFCLESDVHATRALSPDLNLRSPSSGSIRVHWLPEYLRNSGSLKEFDPVLLRSVLMSIVHSKIVRALFIICASHEKKKSQKLTTSSLVNDR
jgi:hypothetical protein